MAHDGLLDTLIVFAVAQRSFQTAAESGAQNTFCTLRPVLLEGGVRARADDFPNNGLVWWKLRATSLEDAVPGRLLAGYIEHALQYSPHDPHKQFYQAVADEITPITPEDVVEIYTVRDPGVASPRHLVSTPGVIELDHPPSDEVLVRWRGQLWGLFHTSIAASGAGQYRVTLSPATPEREVLCMPDVAAGGEGHLRLTSVQVSLDNHQIHRSQQTHVVSYELLTPDALARQQALASQRLVLMKDDELIQHVARRVRTRTQRQRLAELLDDLRRDIDREPAASELDADEVIDAVRRAALSGSAAVEELAEALLAAEALREPIAQAIERRVAQHIEEGAAALGAEIQERVAAERERLDALRHEREDMEADLEASRRDAARQARDIVDAAWLEHRARVEADLARLDEQATQLTERLGGLAARFGAEHERLLGDLLVLLPVLQRTARSGCRRRSASSARWPATRAHAWSRPRCATGRTRCGSGCPAAKAERARRTVAAYAVPP